MKNRCFLAIPIPPFICDTLGKLQTGVRRSFDGIRWVDPKTLHLTIKFLGEIDGSQIDPLCRAVPAALRGIPPSNLSIAKPGIFPSPGNPRILWAGINGNGENISWLEEVVSRVEDGCLSIGSAPETRPFRPHLTLGRIKTGGFSSRAVESWISLADHFSAGSFPAGTIILYQSILHSSGPEHRPLHTFLLTG